MFYEQHEKKEEQTEASKQNAPFNHGWPIQTPGMGYVTMGDAGYNDYEAFIPHSDVY